MLRTLFLQFWPALIPLGFYLLWLIFISRRVKNGKIVAEHIRRGLLFWAIVASAVLTIMLFIWWGTTKEVTQTGHYVPPTMVDGELVPGHVVPIEPNP